MSQNVIENIKIQEIVTSREKITRITDILDYDSFVRLEMLFINFHIVLSLKLLFWAIMCNLNDSECTRDFK